MKDYKDVLVRAGWILIIVGVLDIAIMIFCVVRRISYASSLNIFALIAGILVLQNRLTATRVISQITALYIGSSLTTAILTPFVLPWDLWLTSLKLYPVEIAKSFFGSALFLLFAVWLYGELTSEPVRAAMDEAHVNYTSLWRKPANGLWVSTCFAVILMGILPVFLTKSPAAQKTRQIAAGKMGAGYKYFVSSLNQRINREGNFVRAIVTAYNDKEIKVLPLEWSEKR
ncbi:MAG TPA: hypothetical protein PLL75_05195 [Candidatus Omnitrophota bacterium]|nr:hypothetical protein [Candidatus Omnitrophota bacterium]HPS37104.1 hypothetical protein [Candidatus Omnitrophota bacterium]